MPEKDARDKFPAALSNNNVNLEETDCESIDLTEKINIAAVNEDEPAVPRLEEETAENIKEFQS